MLAIGARYGASVQMRSEVGDVRGAGSSTIRRLIVVVVALLCMATLAAPAASAASAPVAAGKWATAVCAGLDRWQRALGGRSSKGQNVNDPAAVKATLTKYLDGVVRDTGGFLKQLKAAGVPKVAHGKRIAAALRAEFGKARSIFIATRRRVKRIDVTDKTAFANGVAVAEKGATVAFTTAQVALAKLGTRYPAPALDAALKSAAACRALA